MKILWSVDFSRDSKAAIRFSSNIGFPKESEGLLLHVITMKEELKRLGRASDLTAQLNQLQRHTIERVHHNLQQLAERFLPSPPTYTVLVKEGNPGEEILSVLNKESVDLAVLGTRGLSGIKRFLLGSVSDWIVQEAPCPVLIVRGSGRIADRGMRIVMATDGSPEAGTAVEFLNQLAFPLHSKIVLFHVIEPTDYTVVHDDYKILGLEPSGLHELQEWSKSIQRRREQAQTSLLQQAKKNIIHRRVQIEKIAVGYAADEIIKAAYRFRADLIVMGSRGLTGVKRTLLGSVSNRVTRHAPCSVLVVRKSKKTGTLRI